MFLRTLASAPRRGTAGVHSRILLQAGDVPGGRLAVTWLDLGGWQAEAVRTCAGQQVYVIMDGCGIMHVEDEQRSVVAGDLVYVPREARHRLENVGAESLRCVIVATPALDLERSAGALPSAGDRA